MAETPYKITLFMKRRPGMTVEAFRDYYENHHVPLCEKYSSGVARYIRRRRMSPIWAPGNEAKNHEGQRKGGSLNARSLRLCSLSPSSRSNSQVSMPILKWRAIASS